MKTTLRRLLPVLALCSLAAHAATLSYSDSGTFSASTASSVFSGPSETWAFSFQADTKPAPLSDVGEGGFSLTFSNFSYFLGGSPVAITPVFIRFFSDANGGGFGICFDNGPNAHPGGRTSLPGGPNSTCTEELAAFGTDPIGVPGGAGTMYTGTTSRADIDTRLIHLGSIRRRCGLDWLRAANYYRAGQRRCPGTLDFTDAGGRACGVGQAELFRHS